MADFCSFCYYGDINYNNIIKDNIEEINKHIEKEGYCYVVGGLCEGCCSVSIKINDDRTIEINGKGYIGTLNEDDKIVIDESSTVFTMEYKKKKERTIGTLKTMISEDFWSDEDRADINKQLKELEDDNE